MLSQMPRKYRIAIRLDLTVTWVLILIAGIGAILLSPITILSELGEVLLYGGGAVSAVAGAAAAWGAAANRHNIEWPAAWFAALGTMPYGIAVWWLVSTGEATRLQQASIVSAAILFMVSRALYCGAHAAKLRALHSGETGTINVIG